MHTIIMCCNGAFRCAGRRRTNILLRPGRAVAAYSDGDESRRGVIAVF